MTVQALKFFHKLKQFAPANDKKHFDVVEQALEEVEQYRALGTVEELKEAREKQPKTDWIPCEERLPSEATTYLVTEEVIVCSQKQYVVDIRLFGTENQWLCPTNRKIIA